MPDTACVVGRMRYLDWDVLLFPEDSRVSVQEFRTACHAVYDTDQIQADYPTGLLPPTPCRTAL